MPSYEFECSKCGDRQTKIFKISEYDEETLKDKQCTSESYVPDTDKERSDELVECDGTYDHVFDKARPGHAFKGDGWTPKFHKGANQG